MDYSGVAHEPDDPLCKHHEEDGVRVSWITRLVFNSICNECRTLGKRNARG